MRLQPCARCKEMLTTRNVFQVKRSDGLGVDALYVTHNKPECYSTNVLIKLADRVAMIFERAKKKAA